MPSVPTEKGERMNRREEMNETTAAMVAMRRQGYTYQEIADKYGISRQGVYVRIRNLLTSEERSRRGSNGTYTEAQWEWVAEEFKKGRTHQELAKFLFLSIHTVGFHLRGVTRPDPLPPLETLRDEFNRLAGE